MKLSTGAAEKLLKCLVLVVIIDRTYFGVLPWLTFAASEKRSKVKDDKRKDKEFRLPTERSGDRRRKSE